MKIAFSVPGRLHAFHVARHLQRRGSLAQLLTTYPKFEAAKYGIPGNVVSSYLGLEIFSRGVRKLPPFLRFGWNPQHFVSRAFADWAARKLWVGADVFVGFSGNSLSTLRRATELGMRTVLERHSSHMLVQQELLVEEYARFGLKFSETHPGVIEQELREYERTDVVSVPSSFVRDSFVARGFPKEKILCTPLGVDLGEFRPGRRADSIFRVIYAGPLSIRKGVVYLAQAFSELKLPGAELWLVGELQPEVKPLLAKFLGERGSVRLVPHQPQTALAALYAQADVFCLPSIEDGFGVVVAQAMACGLAVLCSENAGARDLIRDGVDGFHVPARNVGRLKEGILRLHDDREKCRAMGEAARKYVSETYSWEAYTERLIAGYERILSGLKKIA